MAEHNPFPGENNTGHVWDDNLRELKNPPPRWWMLGLWASILWVVGYSLLYPSWPVGQEPTPGILGWSQMKEYQEGMAQVEAKRAKFEDQIKGMSANEILADPGLKQYTLASAKVLFGDNCSACHGSGGQGNPGYPVLADDDWLYGGTTAKIAESIAIGRQGAMTPHKDILTEAEIDTLAKWTVQMAETNGEGGSEEGWNLFKTKGCTACHGQSGNGVLAELPGGNIVTVGAANLTDGIWRFKPGGYESARYTIVNGVNQPSNPDARNAVMPAFGQTGQLTDQEIKKLVVYVHELGGGQ
ncbi:cytochrome-c oxidase, cbb3-type subunit III [Thiorhodococcus minor]|uniref:Cbb3-type cytochrome c oxidase subunit n=1 Tax=Thiorhodococcus minor TaxID=57489 RepID=A0A6M0JXJ2_9GAMM|nr:cytochrome-c oxidase, cbb3-type subunit III [Thiorhodococcus minor]NEV61774.1 cytochrome-c oxidase, cbb3-type subunit III [Thiorhodococcus minor]